MVSQNEIKMTTERFPTMLYGLNVVMTISQVFSAHNILSIIIINDYILHLFFYIFYLI